MNVRRALAAVRLASAALAVAAAALLLIHHDRDPALFPPPDGGGVTVYVADNGFHSDLVLPADRLRARQGPMAEVLTALPQTPFVTVGWGDKRFYADPAPVRSRTLDGLRALFRPGNPAVIRVEPLPRPPAQAYDETVLELRLSEAGFERLARRLDQSFTPGLPTTAPFPQRPLDARYFMSREHFSVVHVCNHWTAELLSAAGAPTRPALDTVSAGLVFDLTTEDHARRLR
jgi:hypothetical protein